MNWLIKNRQIDGGSEKWEKDKHLGIKAELASIVTKLVNK